MVEWCIPFIATPGAYNYLETVGSFLRNVMPYEVNYLGEDEYRKQANSAYGTLPGGPIYRQYSKHSHDWQCFLVRTSGTRGLELSLPGTGEGRHLELGLSDSRG